MDLPATTSERKERRPLETGKWSFRNPGAWLSCIGVIVLFVALRWNNYDAPLIRDEGEYFYSAALLKQGIAPYVNSFVQKPPMIIYTYAFATTVLPNSYWSARFLAYLFVALTTVLLGIIARFEFGPGVALTAMWLFTPMILQPAVEQFCANTEMFLLLPLTAMLALLAWKRRSGGGGAMVWFVAGFLAAITILYKYTAFPLLLVIFGSWSTCKLRTRDISGLFSNWLFAALGALTATVAVLGFFAAKGGLTEFLNCTILFNRFYAASGSFSSAEGFYSRLGLYATDWGILLLGPLYFFSQPGCKEPRIWFWMGLFVTAWITTSISGYGQYYILVMPFWAVLCAVAANRFSAWLAAKKKWNANMVRYPIIVTVVLLACAPDLSWILRTKEQFASNKRVEYSNPFRESETVAKHVAEMTSPDDTVYVAGSEPQILFYAHRRSATRFIIAYPLMIPTPLASLYQKEAMADLEKRRPKVMVFATMSQSWLQQDGTPPEFLAYLKNLMRDHYDLAGGSVRDGNEWRWKEPIGPQDVPHATLLLLRRKPGEQ
ncbi:MAG TPA: glycosyltransferase family 39 protein [Verrucomicrobiae bacterium]|nr:glycosyltransferase family 39 protein [Verrucomicrobiae bacterium]